MICYFALEQSKCVFAWVLSKASFCLSFKKKRKESL